MADKQGTPTAKRAQVAERRRKAVQLRMAGVDLRTIAHQLGYNNPRAVSVDISRAYTDAAARLDHDVEQLRAIELDRLDRMQAGAWQRAVQGDDKAILSVLRIMARRSKLLGLDAPVKLDATVTSELDREIDDLLTRIATGTNGAYQSPPT